MNTSHPTDFKFFQGTFPYNTFNSTFSLSFFLQFREIKGIELFKRRFGWYSQILIVSVLLEFLVHWAEPVFKFTQKYVHLFATKQIKMQ